MHIKEITVNNYKSLRDIRIAPDSFRVLVGANAAGKSNLADCIDFLSDVYRDGLEAAIQRKGGYAGIAFRRQKRARLPVALAVTIEATRDEFGLEAAEEPGRAFKIEHAFAFAVPSGSLRMAYRIVEESLTVSEGIGDNWQVLGAIKRQREQPLGITVPAERPANGAHRARAGSATRTPFDFAQVRLLLGDLNVKNISPSALLISSLRFLLPGLDAVMHALGSMRVFQISAARLREPGVPTPEPELERLGGNLATVVDNVQTKNADQWALVLQTMQAILPDLATIDVEDTGGRKLSLLFKEEGSGIAWQVDEISDGTLQTLALLVAISDPASSLVVLEEIENSVHPWIIRQILEVCREAASRKQIILTTHSPTVINFVRPQEVWVIWRANGESRLEELTRLDPDFLSLWESGAISTFSYLDSGILREAIPPAPNLEPEAVPEVLDRYDQLCAFIMALGEDVQMEELKHYTAFRRTRNFACVEVRERLGQIRVYVKIDPDSIELEKGFTRDVRDIGHWGTGDLEITLRSEADLERAAPLIRRSYAADQAKNHTAAEESRSF